MEKNVQLGLWSSIFKVLSYLSVLLVIVGIVFSFIIGFSGWPLQSLIVGIIGFIVFKLASSTCKVKADQA